MDEHLLREAKKLAAESNRTLTSVIEEALRESLGRRRAQTSRRTPVRLTTFRGKGVQRGVDLDDSASLLDLMERSDDAS